MLLFFWFRTRHPPSFTRTFTLIPYTTRFRSRPRRVLVVILQRDVTQILGLAAEPRARLVRSCERERVRDDATVRAGVRYGRVVHAAAELCGARQIGRAHV